MKSISVLPKSMIVLLSFLAVIGLCLLWGVIVRNGLVKEDENVSTAWANVQTQYQRRADLIPNLVNTVKGYAKHEEQTFKEVVEARAKATEKLKEYQAAQGELGSALGKLIAVSENYPQLKANENFMELQAQLEGTENRINESRKRYNESVQSYNVKVRTFPSNLIANICGFQTKNKFEADAAAQNAPKVEF